LGGALGSAAGGRRRGRSASERGGRVDKSNPGCSWRGSGNSRTFGRLTCHAAGLLGDGALGHRVEAAGQRGRGAENTGHGLAAEDRSRECDPRGAKYPGSRGLKPDSRVQGSIARHPSASRAAKSCRRQDKSTRENSVVKVRADSPVGAVSPRHTRRFDQILTETHSLCSPASRRALASPLSAGE
jgi:hypothetical protein